MKKQNAGLAAVNRLQFAELKCEELQRQRNDYAERLAKASLVLDDQSEIIMTCRESLRNCYLLAARMARKEQKNDNSRSSEWNHIIRFCKIADKDGNICATSVLR